MFKKKLIISNYKRKNKYKNEYITKRLHKNYFLYMLLQIIIDVINNIFISASLMSMYDTKGVDKVL